MKNSIKEVRGKGRTDRGVPARSSRSRASAVASLRSPKKAEPRAPARSRAGAQAKRKRLIQGRDYHGWVWKHIKRHPKDYLKTGLFNWAEPGKPTGEKPTESGKWVRVKFIEVR